MSVFNWTSPIRQEGLSPIPNEVFMEIFKHLRPPDNNPWIDPVYRRDYSRVALVCRFFCSVMLPWIFESMKFAGKTNRSHDFNHAPFCRSIISGCGSARIMATYVKRCSFSDWIRDEDDSTPSWYNKEFQTLYSRALAFMPNVEEVKLMKISVNKYLLKSIVGLKCLTSLSLDFCQFRELRPKDICKLSTLQLKHVRFTGSLRITLIEDILLISHFMCFDALLTVHTNYWPFVARIAEQKSHLPLQELEILKTLEPEDVDLLPKIFQKTPALKKLRISSAATSNHDVQFDDVLPALRELCCPLFLLRSLVPGRPISSIETTMASSLTEISDIQSFFKNTSTLKIHSLCVPSHLYLRIPFWKHFPDLESLRLESVTILSDYLLSFIEDSEVLSQSLSNICNAWLHNPPIQELRLVFEESDAVFDLEFHNKLFSTIVSPRLPQLRRISISDYVVWNKVQEDDVWKPSLHLVPLLQVAKQLRSGEVDFVDYDGFFERILSTAEEFW